jgi:RNA-directed DNA polymerase
MVAVSRSNSPGGPWSAVLSGEMAQLAATGGDVRELQRALWACAKRSPERRFHALYDRIWRSDVLWEAWRRVRRNRGAAGVDRLTLAEVEAYGAERMLGELQRALRQGTYRPAPVRRVAIPKPDGGSRPLGIPTVGDRVVQQAARLVLEPIFEADFLEVSHGYRPRRSATDAAERIRVAFPRGAGGSQRPTSVISSGRSISSGCWRLSRSESRIGAYCGSCACGLRRV